MAGHRDSVEDTACMFTAQFCAEVWNTLNTSASLLISDMRWSVGYLSPCLARRYTNAGFIPTGGPIRGLRKGSCAHSVSAYVDVWNQ